MMLNWLIFFLPFRYELAVGPSKESRIIVPVLNPAKKYTKTLSSPTSAKQKRKYYFQFQVWNKKKRKEIIGSNEEDYTMEIKIR